MDEFGGGGGGGGGGRGLIFLGFLVYSGSHRVLCCFLSCIYIYWLGSNHE